MKKQRFLPILLLSMVFVFTGCSDDDDSPVITNPETGNSIADVVVGNENYSSLEAALIKADLITTLSGDAEYTVFAPNNQAFATFLSDNGFANLDAVPTPALKQLLLNHVLAGEVNSSAINTGYVSNLAEENDTQKNFSMYLNTSNGVMINGNVSVTTADIDADNGVIHGVDKVIALPTIATFAAADPNYSTLLAALADSGNSTPFVNLASDASQNLTVFAPSNTSFDDFLGDLTLGDVSGAALDNILRNHVIIGESVTSDELSNMYVNTSATFADTDKQLSLYVNTDDGVMLNGSSSVNAADIIASNGVMHGVDAVIGLPTVVTFATADPNFSNLVAALTRESEFTYVETLSTEAGTSPAPFTVFAPTNAAFGDLLAELSFPGLGDIPTATLEATLNLHVIAGANVRAEDLTSGTVTTLGGDVTIDASNATITDANGRVSNIIVTDVQASNGVVHAIDKVILPQL